MNKKGQTLGLAIISAIVVFVIGLMIVNLLTPEIDRTRVDMQCSSPDEIHDGVKLFCLVTDSVIPYWIVLIISLAIGGITSKLSIS